MVDTPLTISRFILYRFQIQLEIQIKDSHHGGKINSKAAKLIKEMQNLQKTGILPEGMDPGMVGIGSMGNPNQITFSSENDTSFQDIQESNP